MIMYFVAILISLGIIRFGFAWRKAQRTASQAPPADMEPRPTLTAKRGQAYKFPQDPVLGKLLSSPHHQARSSEPIIHDARGFRKSYPELLGDILQTADLLRTAAAQRSMLDERGLLRDGSLYIGILVRSGYEFIVAFFAIRVMGGACMPIGKYLLSYIQAILAR
jgi:malonyl-CoA/methylmalonyl-CoA synthetase